MPLRTSPQLVTPAHAPPLQVPIFELLQKFNGERVTDDVAAGRRRFRVLRLPPYLAMSVRRFTKNRFFVEKNPTIVNFPVKNLDMQCCLPPPDDPPAAPAAAASDNNIDTVMADAGEEDPKAGPQLGSAGASGSAAGGAGDEQKKKKKKKNKMADKAKAHKAQKPQSTLYNLLSSVSHVGSQRPDGVYKGYVHRAAEGAWYEVQDLILKETVPEAVVISEAYLQVYERR